MAEMVQMDVEIIDTVEAHIAGAPPKLVVLAADGRFFIGRRDGEQVREVTPPAEIATAALLARAVVAGNPQALTAPGAMLGLASALLCALQRCAALADYIDEARTRGEAAEAAARGEAVTAEQAPAEAMEAAHG